MFEHCGDYFSERCADNYRPELGNVSSRICTVDYDYVQESIERLGITGEIEIYLASDGQHEQSHESFNQFGDKWKKYWGKSKIVYDSSPIIQHFPEIVNYF